MRANRAAPSGTTAGGSVHPAKAGGPVELDSRLLGNDEEPVDRGITATRIGLGWQTSISWLTQ
jgi:hypothetical protein